MNEFNIGDKVISNDSFYSSEEVGVIVGIDTKEKPFKKYLVKFDSLDISKGRSYRSFINDLDYIIAPYKGCAIWLDDLIKVE